MKIAQDISAIDEKLLYQVALTLLPGVGHITAKSLLSYCGSVEAIFKAKKSHLIKIPGIGEKTANAIFNSNVLQRAEEELIFIEKNNIQPIFFMDKKYPQRLLQCADSPMLLYFKGNVDFNHFPVVSIVGTRKATEYGRVTTEKIVEDLKPYNPLILSGLAFGIDILAHRAALKHHIANIAIVGHGLDRIYPWQHKETARKLEENGGVLSEFPSGTLPDRENFPMRNRIVAGMADITILVESDIKGGAVITAELANSYNRDVFAVPGRVSDKYSSGCNQLIFNNKANIFTSVDDLAAFMRWNEMKAQPKQQRLFPVDLTEEESVIVKFIEQAEDCAIDQMVQQINMSSSMIASILLELEFKGVICSLPGKRYSLVR